MRLSETMTNKPKISVFDTLAILLLGAAARVGGPVLAPLLQLAAMVLGVLGVLAIVYSRTITAIVLFPSAWVLWYLGYRMGEIINAQPLDLAEDVPATEAVPPEAPYDEAEDDRPEAHCCEADETQNQD